MNKDKNKNLLSSVADEGRYVTQSQFTKFKCKDGRYIMINDKNVLMVEVFSEDAND